MSHILCYSHLARHVCHESKTLSISWSVNVVRHAGMTKLEIFGRDERFAYLVHHLFCQTTPYDAVKKFCKAESLLEQDYKT